MEVWVKAVRVRSAQDGGRFGIRRQGRAVIAAVLVWGAAITCFGLARWLPAALALLAVAGCADVISAVLRGTIIQLGVPDELRGRMMGMQMAAVTGAPRIGDAESGAVAAAFTPSPRWSPAAGPAATRAR